MAHAAAYSRHSVAQISRTNRAVQEQMQTLSRTLKAKENLDEGECQSKEKPVWILLYY